MNWMDSAQAQHLFGTGEHDQKKAKTPKTEAEALREYKTAYVVDTPRARKKLEALAEANGWASLAEYRAGVEARRAASRATEDAKRRDALDAAARITTRQEAIDAYKTAREANNTELARAITQTAKTKGWNIMRKNITEYTTELHDEFTTLITEHNTTSGQWRDDIQKKRITPEYAAEQATAHTTARKERLTKILNDTATYVSDAQQEYDQAYTALITPAGDTNEQLLHEMRATKAWDRIQRELSTAEPTTITVALANRVATADPSTLRAIIEEAPSFLAGRGLDNPEDLVRTLVGKRPELTDAATRITEASKLRDVVTHNANHISKHLDNISANDVDPDNWVAYVNPTTINY